MRGIVATGCTALLLVAGCSDSEQDSPAVTETSAPPQVSEPPDVGVDDGTPDQGRLEGPLRDQSQWVLDLLGPQATGPSAEEAAEHFSSAFLDEVPAEQLEQVLAGIRAEPVTLTRVGAVQDLPDGGQSTELSVSAGEPLQVSIAVDGDGLISGLLLRPGVPEDLPEVGSWDELDEMFADLGGTTRVYVGQAADGGCTTAHATGGSPEPAPSGSVFKLIVLAAVVDAVEAGELTWEQELTITPEVKSLPTGELQDREDNSTVPLSEAATLMISVSDNTATDLLMQAVGPEALRVVVERISEDPDRLTPLLSTREAFQLAWNAPEVREQWTDADPARRTALLEELPSDLGPLASNPFAGSEVVWPDGVGWFLTGEEICRAHALLQEQAVTEAGAPVRTILATNPGLVTPEGATYQGFKGGSMPGVLAYSFYVEEGEEGSGRVLTVQVSHERAILARGFTDLTQAGLGLLVEDAP